jgi:hypothetical protein
MTKEATTSGTIPSNPKMPKLMDNDDMDNGEHDRGIQPQRCVWRPQIGSFIS